MDKSKFTPQNPNFAADVRANFARQQVMTVFGASLTHVAPGEVDITMPFRPELTQQDGFLHAGIVTTIVDSACGYAAFSLMPADAAVLTVEYKVNFLAPATGHRLIAQGRVKKPGRTITVCTGDVFMETNGMETNGMETDGATKLVATMQATMITLMSDR